MFPRPRSYYLNSTSQYVVWSVLLTLLLAFPGFVAAKTIPPASRIVALGDLHGDLERLTEILQRAQLVDAENRWIGGDALLVVTGDFLDRGTHVKAVMDLLMELEKKAPKAGGGVLVLLGNHEMMNLTGDLRYVTPEIYATFADSKSKGRQEKAYKTLLKTSQREAKRLGLPEPEDTPEFRQEWMETHPPGFVEYRKALGPKGKYGRWIRNLPAVVRIGDIIFVHGGIHPRLADLSLDELNKRIKKERKAFDSWVGFFTEEGVFQPYYPLNDMVAALKQRYDWLASSGKQGSNGDDWMETLDSKEQYQVKLIKAFFNMGAWLSVHPDGPLWFRGYGKWSEEEGTPQLAQVLAAYGADYMVVGHTIAAEKEILRRLGGKALLVDTVEPSALEIAGDQFRAISLDGYGPVGEQVSEPVPGSMVPGP